MNEGRCDFGVAFAKDKVYALGGPAPGRSASDTVEVFDVKRSGWQFVAPMQSGRQGLGMETGYP